MSRVGLRDVVSCLFRFVRMTILHNTVKGAFLNPVIYVDKRIIVLNKSPGLVCQLNSPQSEVCIIIFGVIPTSSQLSVRAWIITLTVF